MLLWGHVGMGMNLCRCGCMRWKPNVRLWLEWVEIVNSFAVSHRLLPLKLQPYGVSLIIITITAIVIITDISIKRCANVSSCRHSGEWCQTRSSRTWKLNWSSRISCGKTSIFPALGNLWPTAYATTQTSSGCDRVSVNHNFYITVHSQHSRCWLADMKRIPPVKLCYPQFPKIFFLRTLEDPA